MADYDDESDEALYSMLVQGNHRAFSTLVNRHSDRFYGLAWRMCSDVATAEDVVQDAFMKIWQKPQIFDPDKGVKFTTWFYRVVTNLCLDVLRKRKKTIISDAFEHIEDEKSRPAQMLMEQSERQSQLEHAIQSLPERQKTALNLCFYEDLSNAEAAEIMGIGVKAIESLLMRAKKGIKDLLIHEGLLADETKEASNG